MMTNPKPITIVIPVYADWPSLKDCIESLKKYVGSHHNVMLVNDCGPQASILEKNIKEAIKHTDNFVYLKNSANLGFLKTCNRAVLELDKTKNDVLILNSDTIATEGFLEEMAAVLYDSPKIASVSPRTNNATIATIPLSAAKQKGIDPKKSFAIFKKIKDTLPRYSEVPTTHGFCMMIKRTVIDEYGLFDEVFGKGYGEENDFCMRVQERGYKNVLANRAYVFHLEAKSFTHETKSKMLEKNLQIMYQRHPNYRQQVRDYMEQALTKEVEIEKRVEVYSETKTKKIKDALKRNSKIRKIARRLKC